MVRVWLTSYFHFLSVCGHCGFMLGILMVLVWDVKSPTWPFTHAHLMTSEWKCGRFHRLEPEQQLFTGLLGPESPNVPTIALRDGPKFGSEDITAIPPFMYLWRAIKSDCLDREMTPCLPTNKPSALVSSPLFIIHNLLWCQGQSDSIVMVKGKPAQPELSIRIENPDKNNLEMSDSLDSSEQAENSWRVVESGKNPAKTPACKAPQTF